jgi:hypothetical protein
MVVCELLRTTGAKAAAPIGIAALLGCALLGCTAKMNARDSVEQSLKVYQYCLSQHAQDPSSCDGAWRIYQDDVRSYEALSQGDE